MDRDGDHEMLSKSVADVDFQVKAHESYRKAYRAEMEIAIGFPDIFVQQMQMAYMEAMLRDFDEMKKTFKETGVVKI